MITKKENIMINLNRTGEELFDTMRLTKKERETHIANYEVIVGTLKATVIKHKAMGKGVCGWEMAQGITEGLIAANRTDLLSYPYMFKVLESFGYDDSSIRMFKRKLPQSFKAYKKLGLN
jgi:hypothetical protein